MARPIQLYREHRLPAAQDKVAFLDQERGEPGQEQLPDVSVAVDRLVQRDIDAPCEIIVLVARAYRREAFEHVAEVSKEQRLVFIDCEPESRVQGLQVQPPHAHAGPPYFLA